MIVVSVVFMFLVLVGYIIFTLIRSRKPFLFSGGSATQPEVGLPRSESNASKTESTTSKTEEKTEE